MKSTTEALRIFFEIINRTIGDAATMGLARWYLVMQSRGRATQHLDHHLDHYLQGTGLPLDVSLESLLREDQGAYDALVRGAREQIIGQHRSGQVPLPQSAYKIHDW